MTVQMGYDFAKTSERRRSEQNNAADKNRGRNGTWVERCKTQLTKKGEKTMGQQFLRVEEVAEILDVSTSYAYKVIRELNEELKRKT